MEESEKIRGKGAKLFSVIMARVFIYCRDRGEVSCALLERNEILIALGSV